MWLTSSKVLPVIMLVVIPFSVTILAPFLSHLVPFIITRTGEFPYVFSPVFLISFSSLVYAFYPIKFRNIQRRGISNILIEQDYIKTILYCEIPTLFVDILVIYLIYISLGTTPILYYIYSIGDFLPEEFKIKSIDDDVLGEETREVYGLVIITALMINLGLSVTAGIFWIIIVTIRKELIYLAAKTLFQTAIQEKEATNKAEYLIKATKTYDKYLRRTLNLEINNAKRIYSKILSDSNLNKNESMRQITESFESNDKLEPIKVLSKIAYVEDDKDTFLVDESTGKRLKDMAIFFATIIPVAVAVIQLLLQK
jgi:hypothetical protein